MCVGRNRASVCVGINVISERTFILTMLAQCIDVSVNIVTHIVAQCRYSKKRTV